MCREEENPDVISKRGMCFNEEDNPKMEDYLFESRYVLNKNFEELISLINVYKEDKTIWDIKSKRRLDDSQREFNRLLHNYLSSFASFVDHTRNFRRGLKNDTFSQFYDSKVRLFKIDIVAAFLKDLRNYTLHYKLPPSTASVCFKIRGNGFDDWLQYDRDMSLDKENLLKWRGWTKASKEYLELEEGDSIDIKELIIDYQERINNFYNSLFKKAEEVYQKE